MRTIALSFAVEICESACCQRAIASLDFKAYGSIRQLLGNEFQSLIGILVDFKELNERDRTLKNDEYKFQSLIGILVDFKLSAPVC